MTARARWRTDLRSLFDSAFAFDWATHVDELNCRYGLSGDDELSIHVPESPLWFIGNVEAIQPGAWVLAVSLNPHTPRPDMYKSGHAPEFYWSLWRTHNRDFYWYSRFYGPLARVAAGALGKELRPDQEKYFATDQMVFTNLCPYASIKFDRLSKFVGDLVGTDPGFTTMAQINGLLVNSARPAVVLVNGKDSIKQMEVVYGDALQWTVRSYPSAFNPAKQLWHLQGKLDLGAEPVLVAGFHTLRKPKSHNANVEIDQLIRYIKAGLST